jgi:hypothetical protein
MGIRESMAKGIDSGDSGKDSKWDKCMPKFSLGRNESKTEPRYWKLLSIESRDEISEFITLLHKCRKLFFLLLKSDVLRFNRFSPRKTTEVISWLHSVLMCLALFLLQSNSQDLVKELVTVFFGFLALVLQDCALRYESRPAQSIVPSLEQSLDTINIKPTSDDKIQILSSLSAVWFGSYAVSWVYYMCFQVFYFLIGSGIFLFVTASIVSSLWAGRPQNRGSLSGGGIVFSLHRVRSGGLLSTGSSFPGVKRTGREANHSLLSSAVVENELSYTSSSAHVFIAICVIN